ncbi:unnamed protein product, partial [Brenthis ino]
METDWREILNFSQKDLKQAEKEKLCESLCWMDTDDIELNFSDLKTLFKLAQDILKYKTEQVNSLLGKVKRKIKTKDRSTITDSSAISSESVIEAITYQEEVIKANKDILEQLYADIAELEGRKNKYEKINFEDHSSESSRNTLSEMNALAQLENEISKKNRHIRKLLQDVKILEEENTTLREKLTIFKEKLKESTFLIENITEQLFTLNKENSNLKEALGSIEQEKVNLLMEIDNLKADLHSKDVEYEKVGEDVKLKLQHLKHSLKSHKIEIERLSQENSELRESLTHTPKSVSSPKQKTTREELKIKELQEKLTEASEQMIQSANLIQVLKSENRQLKTVIEEMPDSMSEQKNVSDDGKEKQMIVKLRNKVQDLNDALQRSEQMLTRREEELAEIAGQLQLLRSDEGINALIEGIKNKKRDLRLKDESIKSLVQEVNQLSELVSNLQMENETMREKLQIPIDEKIETGGIIKKIKDLENVTIEFSKKIHEYENKLITVEMDNREKNETISKLKAIMKKANIDQHSFKAIEMKDEVDQNIIGTNKIYSTENIQVIIEENEGLRNGLTEILNFLKDNSTTSSGVLSLECPSLEALLNSMEARKSAGWFSPHMKTVMELKAAQGGKDALLHALHESRKETYQILEKLTKQEQKAIELEKTLQELKTMTTTKIPTEDKISSTADISTGEFGSWMLNVDEKIDIKDQNDIQNIIMKGNILFESQFKQALQYFENKFTNLYDKFTSLAIATSDELNSYSIKEERYKVEIENLKCQIEDDDDDISNQSPGLVNVSKSVFSDRKYAYLEESYKQIRTMNENIKNELLQIKKEKMIEMSTYERKIQNLIISIVTLTDKLRNSIPVELFLQQNETLNEITVKYRNMIEAKYANKYIKSEELCKRLEEDKLDLLRRFHCDMQNISKKETLTTNKILNDIEQSVLQQQLKQICFEVQNKNNEIEKLQMKIMDLQVTQADLINKSVHAESNEDVIFLKEQVQKLGEDNMIIKEQYQDAQNQLDVVTLQLQSHQQKEFNNEIEINMLRHQILDLQSMGDNKAIIARLSGEVLLSQMQTSETQERLEALKITLNKEKQLRAETEEILMNRQNIFDMYTLKYEKKIRNLTETIDILRHQYQGSLPLISIETFVDKVEDIYRKSYDIDVKLNEIEDLRSDLMTKHTIYKQILDISSTKCLEEDDTCPHKLKNIITEETQKLQMDYYNKKLLSFDQSHKKLLDRCSFLEKTLLLVNQGFKINSSPINGYRQKMHENNDIKIEDINSDDDSSSEGNRTITLSHPKTDVKLLKKNIGSNNHDNGDQEQYITETKKVTNRHTQTINIVINSDFKFTQTDIDLNVKELESQNDKLLCDIKQKEKIIEELSATFKQYKQNFEQLSEEKHDLNTTIRSLKHSNSCKEESLKKLGSINDVLKEEIHGLKLKQQAEINRLNDTVSSENQSLLVELKKIESDKNEIIVKYKQLLNKERNDYSKSLKDLQMKLKDLQSKLDQKESEVTNTSDDVKETTNKYTLKICELEDKCFKLSSELSSYEAEFKSQQSEMERWKNLASERLIKMEQLSAQIKERHNHEMESYKAENQHWISQLNETQREHMELRARLTEQKTLHLKQLAEKDGHIEQLRSVINNLKSQILNMQTMLTINDPSFDLSAIVEVEEVSDQQSDRLELKCESSVDFNESHDDLMRMPCSSTAIWQEPAVDRLRREKQLMSKQNAMLRRQIKALAARERRSRLDAQNLKNQVFRISTSGNKVPSAESAALQSKVATLQAQLAGARRDATSSLALWDKCKRAQQASERWQVRYEEKCQDVNKLEASLNLAKSAISRLEKEKRILISRLNDEKQEKKLAVEKHDVEESEKEIDGDVHSARTDVAVSERALYARVEAQQRRIVALELAERGNETLVTEYEKSLAEITALKGQVLKLESTLLEAQIKSPLKNSDVSPELEYWKNYCDMLKEENMQLSVRVSAIESSADAGAGAGAEPHRVARLQHTVLTLRALVSKLQAEQKTLNAQKRADSRPSSAKSGNDKIRNHEESRSIKIFNLKKSISEKDELLQKSKEMLNMAMEKNERLARENMFLRRRLEELTD